jgi:hypothetical protein
MAVSFIGGRNQSARRKPVKKTVYFGNPVTYPNTFILIHCLVKGDKNVSHCLLTTTYFFLYGDSHVDTAV